MSVTEAIIEDEVVPSSYTSESPAARSAPARDDEDGDYPQVPADSPTLREHLLSQLRLLNLNQRDLILDALDERAAKDPVFAGRLDAARRPCARSDV